MSYAAYDGTTGVVTGAFTTPAAAATATATVPSAPKFLFLRMGFVLALDGIRHLAVRIKAFEIDGLIPLSTC